MRSLHLYGIRLASRDRLALVANAVDRDDSPILHEKPQHASVEFADMAQFKKSAAKRLGQRLAVILPDPQFCQTGDQRREVVRITGFNSWSPTDKPVAPSTTPVGRNPEREPPGQGRGSSRRVANQLGGSSRFLPRKPRAPKVSAATSHPPEPPKGPPGRILKSALIEKHASMKAQEFWTSGVPMADC